MSDFIISGEGPDGGEVPISYGQGTAMMEYFWGLYQKVQTGYFNWVFYCVEADLKDKELSDEIATATMLDNIAYNALPANEYSMAMFLWVTGKIRVWSIVYPDEFLRSFSPVTGRYWSTEESHQWLIDMAVDEFKDTDERLVAEIMAYDTHFIEWGTHWKIMEQATPQVMRSLLSVVWDGNVIYDYGRA